jgi:hypothetical protein
MGKISLELLSARTMTSVFPIDSEFNGFAALQQNLQE